MSRDLLSAAHQVLSSNELEIQELVQRVSSARYLDEEQNNKIQCIEFKRVKGGKPFDIKVVWFQSMLKEIEN